MATRSFKTGKNSEWVNTEIALPCVVQLNRGNINVSPATNLNQLTGIKGHKLTSRQRRIQFNGAGTLWVKSSVNSSFSVTELRVPNLSALSLSNNSVVENTTAGIVVASIIGATSGSTLTLTNNAGGRFVLSGSNLLTGLVATDYETSTSHSITITETFAGISNSPRATTLTINVIDVNENNFDYIITNNADWSTIPSNLLTNGGVIGIMSGNYTTKTIAASPSASLTFKAVDPLNKPVIDKLVLGNQTNIILDGLKLVSSTWGNVNTNACVLIQGIVNSPIIRNCSFEGNYRGVIGQDIDVVNALPEVACIAADITGDAITNLEITRSYVGDLLPNGVYSLDFSPAGGTGAEATFTVSNGHIVSTNLTLGGSGYTTTQHRTRRAIWVGQNRMLDYLAWGIRTFSGSVSNLIVEDCTLNLLSNAIKPSTVLNGVTVRRNSFQRIYMDHMSFGLDAANPPFPVTITDNFGTLPFSLSGDSGDPHSDWVQVFADDITSGGITSVDWENITIERNVFIDGNSRGGVQGMIIADVPSNISYAGTRIVGNLVASKLLTLGVGLVNPRDAYVRNNAFIRFDPSDTVNNVNTINMNIPGVQDNPGGGYYAFGRSLVGNNITEFINTSGFSLPELNLSLEPNIQLGLRGATIPYTTVFNNPNATRSTLAEIISAYTPKAEYAGKGPFADVSYIDHINKTTNRSLEPSYIRFIDVINQPISSQITSEWSRVIGGNNGRSISITNGEYRIATDKNGSNSSAWTSTTGVINPNQYVQLRCTTGSSGATPLNVTLTINSVPFTWSVTTASISAFTLVSNNATARSSVAIPVETGIRKIVIAVRFKPDALTSAMNIVSESGASALRLWLPTSSAFRTQMVASNVVQLRPTLTPNLLSKTHLITIDLTDTSPSSGCKWATVEDGILLNNSPGVGGVFDTRSVVGTGTDYGSRVISTSNLFGASNLLGLFGEPDGGGVLANGGIEFFWMHYGDATVNLPDIANSTIRNNWSADLIGNNGQGPLGITPKLYFSGDASSWNAGLANKGSVSATLTKQTGSYT